MRDIIAFLDLSRIFLGIMLSKFLFGDPAEHEMIMWLRGLSIVTFVGMSAYHYAVNYI